MRSRSRSRAAVLDVVMCALVVAASACGEKSPPPKPIEPRPNTVAPAKERGESETRANSAGRPAKEYIAPLLNPRLAQMSHEDAKRELAPSLALTVVEPLPGSLQLVHQTEAARVQIDYLPDAAGKWAFADVVVEVMVANPEAAKAEYGEVAEHLRKHLGKAQWEKGDKQYPTSGYRLGDELAVSLGAIAVPGEPSQVAFSIAKKTP